MKDERKRELLLLYQEEAFQAVYDYWHKGVATNPRLAAQAELGDRANRRRELPGLLERLERTRNAEIRRVLHALIVRACDIEGIEPPALDAVGFAEPPPPDLLRAFFEGLAVLDGAGEQYDHSRDPALLAVNLPSLAPLFVKRHIDVRIDTRLRALLRTSTRPVFVSAKNVNSFYLGKAVHCLVFRHAPPLL